MLRELFTLLLCSTALLVGVVTSSVAAKNRLRGNRLDQVQRWCEGQERWNDQVRAQNERAEWRLLRGEPLTTDDTVLPDEPAGEIEMTRELLQRGS